MDKRLKEIGQTVAMARDTLHWTQQNLADESGSSLRYIQSVEKGEVNLSFEKVCDIFGALDLSVDAFLRPNTPKIERDMAHLRAKLSSCTDKECDVIIKTMEYMAAQFINNREK